MKLIRITAATMIFLILMLLVYVLHALYFRVDVVLYSALFDAAVAAAICGLVLWTWRGFAVLGSLEKLQLVAIWLLTGYIFAISVPTVIDRSLSFYLLEKIEQRGGGIRQDAFEGIFIEEYMHEYRLVDARLTEQTKSGTIEIQNGCVVLTERGRALARFSRVFRSHFLPKQRLLMGTYSDDLTKPFRHAAESASYSCSAARDTKPATQ